MLQTFVADCHFAFSRSAPTLPLHPSSQAQPGRGHPV